MNVKRMAVLTRLCCWTLALLLAAGACLADELRIEDRGVDLTAEISIHYPAVTGMADADLQDAVNEKILEACLIREYLDRGTALISGGRLKAEWKGGLLGDVFSCAVSAEGALRNSRTAFQWTGCCIDLRDGHEISAAELFTDAEAAGELMEAYLEETVAPELSAHLLNSELLPLPDLMIPERTGLALLYPQEKLSTLGDRAGEIRIPWHVLRPVLNLEENGIPARMGVREMITLSEESGKALLAEAAKGSLPGIPAVLGDSMQTLTDRYHLLTDPDGFEGGRLFFLEGGGFRGTALMTDDLGRSWENSRVEGIRMDQGCAWGLCVGETLRDEWLSVLGEPELTARIDEDKAEANRLVPGRCDYYSCGAYKLRLYSDENEVLASIVLAE